MKAILVLALIVFLLMPAASFAGVAAGLYVAGRAPNSFSFGVYKSDDASTDYVTKIQFALPSQQGDVQYLNPTGAYIPVSIPIGTDTYYSTEVSLDWQTSIERLTTSVSPYYSGEMTEVSWLAPEPYEMTPDRNWLSYRISTPVPNGWCVARIWGSSGELLYRSDIELSSDIAAVPEPYSILSLLCGIGGIGCFALTRRTS